MAKFYAQMNLAEALRAHPGADRVFKQYGLLCLRCSGSNNETIAQAARAHGIPVDVLLEKLNALGRPGAK